MTAERRNGKRAVRLCLSSIGHTANILLSIIEWSGAIQGQLSTLISADTVRTSPLSPMRDPEVELMLKQNRMMIDQTRLDLKRLKRSGEELLESLERIRTSLQVIIKEREIRNYHDSNRSTRGFTRSH